VDKAEVRRYVGRKVAEARGLAELKQDVLAGRLGLRATALSMIETGANAVTVERLLEIAELTGRDVTWFLPGVEAPDVAAALQQAFPGITDSQVRGVLEFAGYLRSPQSRVGPGGGGTGR
jgi:transcriptional regulator with XRE-family HTH domain